MIVFLLSGSPEIGKGVQVAQKAFLRIVLPAKLGGSTRLKPRPYPALSFFVHEIPGPVASGLLSRCKAEGPAGATGLTEGARFY